MEQTTQKQIQVIGSWVTVDVYGSVDGPAIVLVPGVMADAAGYGAVAAHLDQWETVVVMNRRGRAPSGPLTDDYDVATEVRDVAAVLREFPNTRTLFGWSYGGLILMHLTNELAVPHLIAYEPIMAPFGSGALPALRDAAATGDLDAVVEAALVQVTGMPADVVDSLRSEEGLWSSLRAVSAPLPAETQSLNDAAVPTEFATEAARTDLIVGGNNSGQAPYGTTFEDVAARTPRATVHQLEGQGHLAHLEDPQRLAALINHLDTAAS